MKIKDRIKWAMRFESSRRWLNAILAERTGSRYTLKNYTSALWKFSEYTGMNPDELIQFAKRDRRKLEDALREFIIHIQQKYGLKRSSLASYVASIRSFFKFNEINLRVKQPKSDAIPLSPHTLEEIRQILSVADVRERAIVLLLKDGGFSREDVVTLRYGDIRKEFESGKQFIHIRLLRQKENIAYDTFIGKNAVEALKAYFAWRKNRGEKITDESPLIATRGGKPLSARGLSTLFLRLTKKSGIKTSPHRLRKTFESYLGLSAPSILVKYWLGHSLGVERSYFLPPIEKQREAYMKAYHELDISKKESEIEPAIQSVAITLRLQGYSESKIQKIIEILRTGKYSVKQIPDIVKKVLAEKEASDCQKIVSESELEEYLQKGWEIKAVLPSGRIVVSNE